MALKNASRLLTLNCGDLTNGNYTFIDANGDLHQYGTSCAYLLCLTVTSLTATDITTDSLATGSVSLETVTVTETYAVASDVTTVFANCLTQAVTVGLPAASLWPGRIVDVKCTDNTNTCTVFSASSIDGNLNTEIYLQESLTMQSDGTTWRII